MVHRCNQILRHEYQFPSSDHDLSVTVKSSKPPLRLRISQTDLLIATSLDAANNRDGLPISRPFQTELNCKHCELLIDKQITIIHVR